MQEETQGAAQVAAPAPTGHSRFGASGAHRWTVCTGSISAQEGQPNDSSEYAAEGTALHALSAQCLTQEQDAAEWIDRTFYYDDHGEQKEIAVDEDQAEAVQVYLDTVRADAGELMVETRFHLSHLHPEFFGTSDACRVNGDTLRVYDAKFGRGKIVEPADAEGRPNKQLGFYALGALYELGLQNKAARVELVVVQPRAWHRGGPVRRATFTVDQIKALGGELVAKAEEAEYRPQFVAGDHCTFCRAAHSCKALRDAVMDTAQMDFDDAESRPPDPRDMSPQEIERALDAADMAATWWNAVRARAHALVDSGRIEIPGWALKTSEGHRKWRDEAAAATALCYEHGLDESSIYSHKLLSPAQVEKKLPGKNKKERAAAIAHLLADRSIRTTLVRASHPDAGASGRSQTDWDDGLSQPEGSDW